MKLNVLKFDELRRNGVFVTNGGEGADVYNFAFVAANSGGYTVQWIRLC